MAAGLRRPLRRAAERGKAQRSGPQSEGGAHRMLHGDEAEAPRLTVAHAGGRNVARAKSESSNVITNYDCSTAATKDGCRLSVLLAALAPRAFARDQPERPSASRWWSIRHRACHQRLRSRSPISPTASRSSGRPELELSHDGAVWRFRNEGNRAAFAEHPESIRRALAATIRWRSRAVRSVPGHPLFWAVSGERLYLFYSAEDARRRSSPIRADTRAAARNWPRRRARIALLRFSELSRLCQDRPRR